MIPMKSHQICEFIEPCSNLRNGMVQFLILGLTLLSFYSCYYTITDERYQPTTPATRHPLPRGLARSILGTSEELPEPSSLIYATVEPKDLNASHESSKQPPALNGEASSVKDKILEPRNLDGSSNNIIKPQPITNEEASSAKHPISEPQLDLDILKNTIKHPIISNGGTSSVQHEIMERRKFKASNNRRYTHRPTSPLSEKSGFRSPSEPAVSKSGEQTVIKDALGSEKLGTVVATANQNELVSDIYQAGHSVPIPEKCPDFGAGLELLILIMSAPSHVEARTAIRLTWGAFGQRKDVSIAFLLGNTTDSEIEDVLLDEQNMYRDIIRGNSLDSYSNLTLKAISALEWVCDYCSGVKFVLKTDDDMFINVPRLLSFINDHSNDTNVIYGRLARAWLPSRNSEDKYYVPPAQYEPEILPDFTTGPAYLLSRDVIPKLYEESLKQGYMRLEDVFITGIVGSKLGIKRTQAGGFKNQKISFNPCTVNRTISIHMVKYREQFDLWKMLLDGVSECK